MGHGANDKLYITHAEHSGALGQHSASSGHKQKADTQRPATRVPFDCCALSFQPFVHPVLARNADGTGTVFDLLNILPYLKEHKNTHPRTNEPLTPDDLIKLNYSRNASGELNDPVTFKIFSEHSHIVAIATSGNVYLAESVKQFAASGRDLVDDTPFKKEDIITLQDPHGLGETKPAAPVASTSKAASSSTPSTSDVKSTAVAAPKKTVVSRASSSAQPYNASPYSTGNTGASLTSTAVAPLTSTDVALFDEEELMFDDVQLVRKEKDRVKKRAYVRISTNMGGSLNVELFCDKAPKTCYNWLMLARQGKYDNVAFHRLIPNFMIQGGDPTETGRGGSSYWGTPFRDEFPNKDAETHTSRGMLSMANSGLGTNGSQFFITFRATPHLDGKHTVFGKVVGGEGILDAMERVPVIKGSDKPARRVEITGIDIYTDPFQEYKERLARRLRAKGEIPSESSLANGIDTTSSGPPSNLQKKKGERDDVNWFGVKLGEDKNKDKAGAKAATGAGSGIGKYLPAPGAGAAGAKRTAEPVLGGGDDAGGKKKRKLGFGNFDAW